MVSKWKLIRFLRLDRKGPNLQALSDVNSVRNQLTKSSAQNIACEATSTDDGIQ